MDTENNKYKKIVKSIVENKNLENSIGLYVGENFEEESKIDYYMAKRLRRRKYIIASIFTSFLIAALVIAIIGSFYPMTPTGVVKAYLFEVENDNFERAGMYVNTDDEMKHDFFDTDEFSFKIVYNVNRSPNDRKMCTVDVWIEYLDEIAYEYTFRLRKSEGKWRIIARENGNSD